MELGKANYGSNKLLHKMKDGDNIFRILPPMGKLAKKGFWNTYYRIEWGFRGTDGKQHPFQDVRVVNFKTKMVEVESASHLRREALLAEKVSLIAALRKDPKNEALKNKVLDVTELIKRYNLDAKYYLNVVSLDGKIGLLKVGSRAFKALKEEIDKLRKTGVDPLSVDNGRFFNFHRSNPTGNFQDTAYQVTVYKTNVVVSGETYQKDLVHKMDEAFISRLSSEAFELSGMYPEVTVQEVEEMVKEGATAVDRILGSRNSRNSPAETEDFTTEETPLSLNNTIAAMSTAQEVETLPLEEVEDVSVDTLSNGKKDLNVDEFLKSLGVSR